MKYANTDALYPIFSPPSSAERIAKVALAPVRTADDTSLFGTDTIEYGQFEPRIEIMHRVPLCFRCGKDV